MKRWHKIVIGLAFVMVTWIWSKDSLDYEHWIGLPMGLVFILGLYVLSSILTSVLNLSNNK